MVVPTYNERDRLPDLVRTRLSSPPIRRAVIARSKLWSLSTIIRPTAPVQVADDLATRYPITVVHRAGKLGLGTAVVAGFTASEAQVVGVMDMSRPQVHPPALVPRMLTAMLEARADFVIGSRYIPGGGTPRLGAVAPAPVVAARRVTWRAALTLGDGDATSRLLSDTRATDRQGRDHQGGRLQDLSRAARASLAAASGGDRGAVSCSTTRDGRREQDEPARSAQAI